MAIIKKVTEFTHNHKKFIEKIRTVQRVQSESFKSTSKELLIKRIFMVFLFFCKKSLNTFVHFTETKLTASQKLTGSLLSKCFMTVFKKQMFVFTKKVF